jgi:hypothetical protein
LRTDVKLNGLRAATRILGISKLKFSFTVD